MVGSAGGLAGQEWPANTNSSNSTTGSARLVTDLTEFTDFSDTLSERFATLDFSKDVNVATLDDEGKVAELKVMFPGLSELDMKIVLKKGKGDFIKACEELLNMQYLEENGLRPKGIDGAFRLDAQVGYKGKLGQTFLIDCCFQFACYSLLYLCNLNCDTLPPPPPPAPWRGLTISGPRDFPYQLLFNPCCGPRSRVLSFVVFVSTSLYLYGRIDRLT